MNRQEDLALRDALLSLPESTAVTPDCLDDETIAAFAEAGLEDAAREAALAHLASCRRCRGVVASVSRALADHSITRAASRVARTAGLRSYRILVPLAAAAVLFVFIRLSPLTDADPQHRAPTIGSGATPIPAAPIGTVAGAPTLGWRSVAGADRYRVTLFAEGGAVLYESQLADTLLSLPDTIVLLPAQRYLWKVEARTGFDRWVASDLVEFTIAERVSR